MTAAKNAGAFLRTDQLAEFRELGALGDPVWRRASALRAALSQRLDRDAADLFAVPEPYDDGRVAWYSPRPGTAVPWNDLSTDERRALTADLERTVAKIDRYSDTLLRADASNDERVFATLLRQATTIPDLSHLYGVAGKPVLSFWGFAQPGAAGGRNPIRELFVRQPDEAKVGTADLELGTPPRSPREEATPTARLEPAAETIQKPESTIGGPQLSGCAEIVTKGLLWSLLLLMLVALLFAAKGCPWVGGNAGRDDINRTAPVLNERTATNPTRDVTTQPLVIPEDALVNRDVSFLQGTWLCKSPLTVAGTKEKIEMRYELNANGTGTQTIVVDQSHGHCVGEAIARIEDGVLTVDVPAGARCDRGRSSGFTPSKVTCRVDPTGQAACVLDQPDRESIDVRMQRVVVDAGSATEASGN